MNQFKTILAEKNILFGEDEFTTYKNTYIIMDSSIDKRIVVWLRYWLTNIEDEFIGDAIQEIIDTYFLIGSFTAGINFKYNGSEYSVSASGGSFSFSSDNKIDEKRVKRVKKIIGN